ncbi:MAG: beta-Ala-His dipeptidase [Clostridia bacterium]|nr:beta-Ala-His dipeptidase [Clostridia bacterium]
MLKFPECAAGGRVFEFFEEISKIPHGSGNTAPIADYLEGFARERALTVIRDGTDNVIIKKPATKGYEDRPCVIIQGHTDMVLAQEKNVNIDLQNEGLKLYIDGDFLKAEGTTLGADDGIAVAYALALLDSKDIPHPAIEAVFTSDEEIGLLGAAAIDGANIDGRILINIDSDAEGVFTAGCAGGLRTDTEASFDTKTCQGHLYTLSVSALRGGHSGIEINRGRTNAIKYLFKILSTLDGVQLVSLNCGNADNASPRDARATFVMKESLSSSALSDICDSAKNELAELGETDAGVTVTKNLTLAKKAISAEDSVRVIELVNEMPSGVLAMSEDIEGLVETSQNIGILTLEDGNLRLTVSVRSAKGASKREAADNIHAIAEKYGAKVTEHGEYPSWEYRRDSHLRDVMCEVYEKMYQKPAKVDIIHAGLECGLFSDKLEGLDAISFGPDNYDIHTPSERLSISSAVRVWEFLLEVLKNI